MLVSSVFSMAIAAVPAIALSPVLGKNGFDIPWLVAMGATVALWLYIDLYHVFPWGFERFDLVAPWQFREVEVDDGT